MHIFSNRGGDQNAPRLVVCLYNNALLLGIGIKVSTVFLYDVI